MARVIIGACQVQGQGAAQTIVAALRRLSRWTDAETGRGVDLVILARGGGSLEDLWPFNDEIVVRAVAASPCPIVVGVGHETDVTLAEFAADVRAATPSVAAELAVPARADELARVRNLRGRLDASAGRSLRERRQAFDSERRALDGYRPAAILAAQRETVGLLLDRATRLMDVRLERRRTEFARSAGKAARRRRPADRPGTGGARANRRGPLRPQPVRHAGARLRDRPRRTGSDRPNHRPGRRRRPTRRPTTPWPAGRPRRGRARLEPR